MSTIEILAASYEFNRARTLALLDTIESEAAPLEILGWRPGTGRAHIAWQLMHIAVTEEIFAGERLREAAEGEVRWQDLWPRFRGGSTPDDDVPEVAVIRQVLTDARAALSRTLTIFSDADLETSPPGLAKRGQRLIDALHIIAWHEGHHHGQAHLALNLYRAAQ